MWGTCGVWSLETLDSEVYDMPSDIGAMYDSDSSHLVLDGSADVHLDADVDDVNG